MFKKDNNSGDYNSGYRNSGNYNSGYRNSGYRNSGDYNSGYRNSGHRNSGHRNSGNCNSGDYNSGFFNTNEPTVRMFNKDTGLKRSEINIPYIDLKITQWVPEEKMTDEQKANDKNFHIKGGTLINRTYKEAWSLYWKDATEDSKQKFLDLPNFDAELFEEITGIDVGKKTKTIIIDGKSIEISEDSFDAFKKQFN